MDTTPTFYELAELGDLAGVTPRTIRYYIEQGLLPQVGAGREARKYGDAHLNRLRLIRQFQKQNLALSEIRKRLAGLSDEAVAHSLSRERPAVPKASSARDYLDKVLGGRDVLREPAPQFDAGPGRHAARVAEAMSLPPPPIGASAADVDPMDAESMLSTGPVIEATPADEPPLPEPAPAPTDAWPRARAQWERLSLHDDVELHVRRPLSRDMNRRLERLLEVARRILHDD